MSYLDYVIAAYAVFAAVLAWDFVVPRIHLRAALRAARLQAARRAAGKSAPLTELQR
jgi:heme exporter protein D